MNETLRVVTEGELTWISALQTVILTVVVAVAIAVRKYLVIKMKREGNYFLFSETK